MKRDKVLEFLEKLSELTNIYDIQLELTWLIKNYQYIAEVYFDWEECKYKVLNWEADDAEKDHSTGST